MKPIVNIYRLGRLPYKKAFNIQQALFDKLRFDTKQDQDNQTRTHASNSLLLLEHEPVYTVGIRSHQYNQDFVLKLRDKLAQNKQQAEFVQANRGGLITFHGPGQLVAYPIIQLGDFSHSIPNKSVKAYVKRLEETIIATLARVGVKAAHTLKEYPGVWLDNGDRKIAFVGIACKRYVTMHGISINCDCDLTWFQHIVSCGIEGKAITSVQREMLCKTPMATITMTGDNQSDNREGHLIGSSPMVSSDGICPGDREASNQNHLSDENGLTYGVQRVANAFCLSFSQQFGCELQERRYSDEVQMAKA